jgi:hypothetical protein
MHVTNVGSYPLTLGALVALLVLILAILGLLGVVPFGQNVVFAMLAALAVARLI